MKTFMELHNKSAWDFLYLLITLEKSDLLMVKEIVSKLKISHEDYLKLGKKYNSSDLFMKFNYDAINTLESTITLLDRFLGNNYSVDE